MKKKSMSEKLAAGVRQAKQHNTDSVTAAPPVTSAITPAAVPAKASPQAAQVPAKTYQHVPAKTNQHSAQQADQRPASSLDDPWANLHPQRIWPD